MKKNLSPAQTFIYAHACNLIEGENWQKAAQHALRKIQEYRKLPKKARPPVMLQSNWERIEAEINAIGGCDGLPPLQ